MEKSHKTQNLNKVEYKIWADANKKWLNWTAFFSVRLYEKHSLVFPYSQFSVLNEFKLNCAVCSAWKSSNEQNLNHQALPHLVFVNTFFAIFKLCYHFMSDVHYHLMLSKFETNEWCSLSTGNIYLGKEIGSGKHLAHWTDFKILDSA